MSLLDEYMEEFELITKQIVLDDYGGYDTGYASAGSFMGAVVLDSSIEARVAELQGVTALYTLTTPRSITLEYHDIVRRISDGKYFRVTSDGDDKKTPQSATLDMRQVSCEEWKMEQDNG